MTALALAEGLDLAGPAERLRTTGRTRIEGLLGDGAAALADAIADPDLPWNRSILTPYDTDLPVSVFDAQPLAEQARLIGMVHEEAAEGFQYVFDRVRLAHSRAQDLPLPPALYAALDLFNSASFLDFARRLTGDDRIAYADAQATRYLPGHFLNPHTDELEATGRLYAYVLNLSPVWRPDWGGLLMFTGARGEVVETLTPRFGALNLFRVPQEHLVSMVSAFAPAPRYSITGWWRMRTPEAVSA